MTNSFVKQVKSSAKDEAIRIAKNVRNESKELVVPKVFKKDSNKSVSSPDMSVIQQVMTKDGKVENVSDQEKVEGEVESKIRLQELENELASWRQKRLQKESEWSKQQEEVMGLAEEEMPVEKQPVIMPTSPKKGPQRQIPGQKKKGTMEEGRTRKG